jgi:hypothetical protein
MSPIQTQVLKLHEPLLTKSSEKKKKKKNYQTPTKPKFLTKLKSMSFTPHSRSSTKMGFFIINIQEKMSFKMEQPSSQH